MGSNLSAVTPARTVTTGCAALSSMRGARPLLLPCCTSSRPSGTIPSRRSCCRAAWPCVPAPSGWWPKRSPVPLSADGLHGDCRREARTRSRRSTAASKRAHNSSGPDHPVSRAEHGVSCCLAEAIVRRLGCRPAARACRGSRRASRVPEGSRSANPSSFSARDIPSSAARSSPWISPWPEHSYVRKTAKALSRGVRRGDRGSCGVGPRHSAVAAPPSIRGSCVVRHGHLTVAVRVRTLSLGISNARTRL